MDRLLIALPLLVVAIGIALVAQRRRPDAPSQPTQHVAPAQLDRDDFADPDRPWLVVAFTSATCDTCASVAAKAAVLASAEVSSVEVEYSRDRDLHERYAITAVPTVVIADAAGVVQRSFIGPTSATHLWAALAEAREPGSVPPGCGGHDHD
ncbi:MAG: thioredoxin domain-containing protein [Acidimicrobiales bacterium]